MANKPLPSPEVLRQLLRYEPETGKLFWKERGPEWFESEPRYRGWNKRCSGKEAFTSRHGEGYKCGKVLDCLILAHRAIWAIQTGDWPAGDTDHIDGDRSNNRWLNLRAVDRTQNMRNAKRFNSNSSGHVGVWWSKPIGRWISEIKVDRKKLHLGTFMDIADAIAARKDAEKKYEFHDNHGRANI